MRCGTIGTSRITHRFIEAAQDSGKIAITAVYSRTERKAKKLADQYGIGTIFTDLKAMAKSDAIDCVYIASPNSLHFEQAVLFLIHNKHVICEKPIFSNEEELDEAFQIADKHDVFLFEAMRNVHVPNFKQLQSSLPRIGKVRSIFLHRVRYSSKYDDYLKGEIPNVFSPDFSGGALMDLGIYPLHLAISLFGKPLVVDYKAVKLSTGVDGSGTLVLDYGDFSCTILCSKISTSYLHCELHGEEGSISFEDAAKLNNIQYINRQMKQPLGIPSPDIEHDMAYEIKRFLDIIETKDIETYKLFRSQSKLALQIIDEARRQNQIVFTCER